jgi:hypothetical protein
MERTFGGILMNIKRFLLVGLALIAMVSSAQAGVRLGIGIGIGLPCYGPCYRPYYYPYPYYYPAPVVVAPAPAVVAAPAPVVVAPTAVAANSAPAAAAEPASNAPPLAPPPPTVRAVSASTDLAPLNDPNPNARAEACIRLGRNKDRQAASSLIHLLKEDASPTVREAAARALGLIGAPAALPALQHAAGADDDRDVRRSASFAAEVIRTNMRR